jgi:hypothetical protein
MDPDIGCRKAGIVTKNAANELQLVKKGRMGKNGCHVSRSSSFYPRAYFWSRTIQTCSLCVMKSGSGDWLRLGLVLGASSFSNATYECARFVGLPCMSKRHVQKSRECGGRRVLS